MKINPLPPRPPSREQRQSLPKEVKETVEDAVAEAIEFGAKSPFLKKAGHQLYDRFTRPKADTPELANVGQLSPTLLRGAQPTEQGFAALKKQGVQTVINLRPEENWEEDMVVKQGMKYLYLPVPPVAEPTNEQALKFLSAVTDSQNGKVYFHCQRGIDRTGAMAGAYRIAVQGWTLDQAAAEMRQFGFKDGFEQDKLDFLRGFASYWKGLPSAEKATVLHRSVFSPA
ncbi:MAG TPA: dual specificity protein phosphatase family protein [Chroococcales cyanobacterium]|jgi:protein tyrosine/serine phosphatase